MQIEARKRIIQGIILINLSIFILSAYFLTDAGSYTYVVGNQFDEITSKLFSRKGWSAPLVILLCSGLLSMGTFMISVKAHKSESKKVEEGKKGKTPYWS
ncbi:MAG: hypothetical protein P8O23_06380 [Opitutales bacterium]|nr:hypothetical protein [Opitutales bacterium]